MKRMRMPFALAITTTITLWSLVGCDVTPSDVKSAKNDVLKEQQETELARSEGDKAVRVAEENEKRLRETAMRDAREKADEKVQSAAKETAEARREREAQIAKEEMETAAAKVTAERLAAELAATQARNLYVAGAEADLTKIDARLGAMREQAKASEGQVLTELKTKIEILEIRRKAVFDAVEKLKAIEVLRWESEKAAVEAAIKSANQDD